MKKITIVLTLLLLAVWLASCSSAGQFPVYDKAAVSQPLPEINVKFFNAGKADSILIKTPNSTLLIDAGEQETGDELVSYFKDSGIDRLDALVITHFDKDHAGGADTVLQSVTVDTVYQPLYYSNSKQYNEYRDILDKSDVTKKTLSSNLSFELDGVSYYIDVANKRNYGANEENDFSLVISMCYGNTSFLFAGDAENQRLEELISEGVSEHTVLKVPHHGRYHDLSEQFFTLVSPDHAVITSDSKNLEDERIVSSLESLDTNVYLTRNGTVDCLTDGINISFEQ